MKKNLGSADKTIRIIVGLVLFFVGLLTHYIWLVIGLILLLTGIFGWCPIYKVLGLSSLRVKKGHTS